MWLNPEKQPQQVRNEKAVDVMADKDFVSGLQLTKGIVVL